MLKGVQRRVNSKTNFSFANFPFFPPSLSYLDSDIKRHVQWCFVVTTCLSFRIYDIASNHFPIMRTTWRKGKKKFANRKTRGEYIKCHYLLSIVFDGHQIQFSLRWQNRDVGESKFDYSNWLHKFLIMNLMELVEYRIRLFFHSLKLIKTWIKYFKSSITARWDFPLVFLQD